MVNLEVINNLWLEIDKLHLSYLQTEESPERIQQKRKLKVTSNQRFYSPTTKAVLYTSILKKGDQFSSSKFSHAWEMLGVYAANLLGQPWRKEFKEIRLYSGGYKYQIEHQLLGAEDILMEMGYTLDIEFNRLIVQGMLDYDRIVRSHRDCLLAQVESEILSEIHSALNSSMKPSSWAAIFDYRDKYVGSVNHCVRGLMYQQAQKEHLFYSYNPQPPPLTPYLGPHEIYPTSLPYPMMYPQPYLKSSYSYPTPIHHKEVNVNHLRPSGVEEQELRSSLSREPAVKPKVFEKSNVEQIDARDNSTTCDMKNIPKFEDLLDIERLERLIYDDVDSRDIKRNQELQPAREMCHQRFTHERVAQTTDKETEMKEKSEILSRKLDDALALQLESLTSKKPSRLSPNSVRGKDEEPERRKKEQELYVKQREIKTTTSKEPNVLKFGAWECLFCTFCNTKDKEICEMCAKSRNLGPESQPLHRGGRECSNCTLVNPPDEKICAACFSSLTDAPTYI